MELPSGVVTFLFTDIESSTSLARELGDAYSELLDEHRRMIREAVRDASGHEIDCRADEYFAAFAETEAAVAAAVAAQRALSAHGWPRGATPRVRMGIHAGEAELGDGSYVGLEVHRAARVTAAAAGGQILVSSSARSRVPAGPFEFADLGEHRLPGFGERERIFQVLHEDLPGELGRRQTNAPRKDSPCAL